MALLPQLPSQFAKVRYAAILVIGRYASWTKMHPEFIPYQMNFISKGFEDRESVGAASQSLRFLCDECGEVCIFRSFSLSLSLSLFLSLSLSFSLSLYILVIPYHFFASAFSFIMCAEMVSNEYVLEDR
jgi:hypothetical protein